MKKSFIFAVLSVTLLLFVSCDSGLEISSISIEEPPNKTVYTVSKDTELKLDGLKINVTCKNGNQYIDNWQNESIRKNYIVNQSVDFSKAGRYTIVIERNKSECSFIIKVVE